MKNKVLINLKAIAVYAFENILERFKAPNQWGNYESVPSSDYVRSTEPQDPKYRRLTMADVTPQQQAVLDALDLSNKDRIQVDMHYNELHVFFDYKTTSAHYFTIDDDGSIVHEYQHYNESESFSKPISLKEAQLFIKENFVLKNFK